MAKNFNYKKKVFVCVGKRRKNPRSKRYDLYSEIYISVGQGKGFRFTKNKKVIEVDFQEAAKKSLYVRPIQMSLSSALTFWDISLKRLVSEFEKRTI